MVDCILCYAVTQLVSVMTDPASAEGREHVAAIKGDARAARQFLILAHLYAKTDAAGLASLRRQLLPPRFPPAETAVGLAAGVGVLGGMPSAPWPVPGVKVPGVTVLGIMALGVTVLGVRVSGVTVPWCHGARCHGV